ncbi:aminoglycoside 6-adenylyltransferase [Ornithinibacillus scapharcae]|uniref:aminoglycoside 6-adenylyltransferase n=1 Tax=Ornithinibacillus scapharcae TaxID=1147159 RepID=UPI000225B8F0|nr:aminoglycoside 6-adenylyltransferase [Ornithinibacillus scapharcae]
MRSEKEMMELILSVANEDDRIRAVYMNGSRTNANAPTDIFQDYDIVYVVSNVESFTENEQWISVFGEILMLQEPEKNDKALGRNVNLSQNYGYLMLFQDGNRIDLHLQTKEFMLENYKQDSLTKPLLDKEDFLPSIPVASDRDYWVLRPSKAEYFSACNDFWWCTQNVAKGIWRQELPYAQQMLEEVIRPRLKQIISWWIGIQYNFQISPGKMGKYFEMYLPKEYWDMYVRTYADGDYEHIWDSLFVACKLFRVLALEVAKTLSYQYILEDDQNMMRYLRKVHTLPKNAKEIF